MPPAWCSHLCIGINGMHPAKAERDMNWVALGPCEMCKTGNATITTYQLVQRKGVDP